MKFQGAKPGLFSIKSGEFSLSGPALIKLLRAVLERGAPFRFRARGFSMSPFIRNGDVITVSPLSAASPRIGDVAAFIHPRTRRLVVHRIIGKKGVSFFHKGG